MGLDDARNSAMMRAQVNQLGEVRMVDQERWAEIRRLFHEERVSISEIGRRLDVDRKTGRNHLRHATWRPYHRAAVTERLLTPMPTLCVTVPRRSITRRGFCTKSCGPAAATPAVTRR